MPQIPNSKLQRNTRSQTPNTKLQTPEKLQATSSRRGPRFGAWSFFGVWTLVFGVSIPGFLWSLGFGAWRFAQRWVLLRCAQGERAIISVTRGTFGWATFSFP